MAVPSGHQFRRKTPGYERRRMGRRYAFFNLLFLIALPSLFLNTTGAAEQRESAQVPDSTRVAFEDTDSGRTLELLLTHEVLYDPEDSMLFNRPQTLPTVGPNGNIYWVDLNDQVVRVFDGSMAPQRTIGGPGPGPGEFEQPWTVALRPSSSLIYVLDRANHQLSEFALDGTYIRGIQLPAGLGSRIGTLFFVQDDVIAVNTTSVSSAYYGAALHLFRIPDGFHSVAAAKVGSLAAVPDYEFGVYRYVAGGFVGTDRDGGILYAERTSYSIQKLDLSGSIIWQVEDDPAFPDALTLLRFAENGRVVRPHHAVSLSILPIGEQRYLHSMVFPPEGYAGETGAFPDGVHWEVVYEMIDVEGGEVRRMRAKSPDALMYGGTDGQGRLYGWWNGDRRVNIRSEAEITRAMR